MQHNAQGELIIVAGNERICIYRTDTARLVSQIVERVGSSDLILYLFSIFQNNVNSVTCMQHATQGELIIIAGNERICIYRTDTARLVSQIVGRVGSSDLILYFCFYFYRTMLAV